MMHTGSRKTMLKWLQILLTISFKRKNHKWYANYNGNYFNLDRVELLYIAKHSNTFGIDRPDFDDLYHVFADTEPVSKGYKTELEARLVLQKFMTNLNIYDVNYFTEH